MAAAAMGNSEAVAYREGVWIHHSRLSGLFREHPARCERLGPRTSARPLFGRYLAGNSIAGARRRGRFKRQELRMRFSVQKGAVDGW